LADRPGRGRRSGRRQLLESPTFTPREQEVLTLRATGQAARRIPEALRQAPAFGESHLYPAGAGGPDASSHGPADAAHCGGAAPVAQNRRDAYSASPAEIGAGAYLRTHRLCLLARDLWEPRPGGQEAASGVGPREYHVGQRASPARALLPV